jgi:hypothetical protein
MYGLSLIAIALVMLGVVMLYGLIVQDKRKQSVLQIAIDSISKDKKLWAEKIIIFEHEMDSLRSNRPRLVSLPRVSAEDTTSTAHLQGH